MESGELERMGDSLGPGCIVEFASRRVEELLYLEPLDVKSCSLQHIMAETQLTEGENGQVVRRQA